MKNPWADLPLCPPFILAADRQNVEGLNHRHQLRGNSEYQVEANSMPEPFLGNPYQAKVVLLSLNPGHNEDDINWHKREDFAAASQKNLVHAERPYPFYLLDPRFKESPGGRWWRKRLRQLIKAVASDEAVAKGVCVIEWFPYHSWRARLPRRFICESQKYSWHLAQMSLNDPKKMALVMRSIRYWEIACTNLGSAYRLKNPQSPYVTDGNLDKGVFDLLCEKLR